MTERLAVNGVELAWSSRGVGPTLVLCHGYTGSSFDFSLQIDPLAASRRVVTLDQRGHGQSTKTGDLASYTIDQLVDDLVAFIEQAADGPVDLLGHSMGGRVALGVVLARPDLIGSLILMDTSAWSFQPDDQSIRTLVADFIDAFDPARGLSSTFNLGGPEDVLIEAATPAAWRQRRDEIFLGMDPYAVKALGTALLSDGVGSVRPQLPSITCPTTVLVGSRDHPLVDQAPGLAAEVAQGTLSVIEGAYHSPQLTHPGEWRHAVEAHLKTHLSHT